MNPCIIAVPYQGTLNVSVVCDAKVRIIVYIASDLSKTLRMINKTSWAICLLAIEKRLVDAQQQFRVADNAYVGYE